MYLTIKQQLKHLSKTDYENLRRLCHTAKDLTNQAIYCCRQYFFNERKYLGYEKVYAELRAVSAIIGSSQCRKTIHCNQKM